MQRCLSPSIRDTASETHESPEAAELSEDNFLEWLSALLQHADCFPAGQMIKKHEHEGLPVLCGADFAFTGLAMLLRRC